MSGSNMLSKRISAVSMLVFLLIGGCATLRARPKVISADQRIKMLQPEINFPLKGQVNVYWQDNLIPFIEAEHDEDAAFAIGYVQASLRMGQMELFRRLTAGRLSESAGPFFVRDIDALIRTMDLGRNASVKFSLMRSEDQIWLTQFVRGINHYLEQADELPIEFSFLALEREAWKVEDVLRIAKLGGADANWFSLFSFLALRNQPQGGETGWERVWDMLQAQSDGSMPSSLDGDGLISGMVHTGSNAVAVSGSRSKSKGAIIASDPHLGIFAPNLWFLMGVKSPTYHVVGYMLPGVPAVTLGRNADIAWGGTYMRGISSHLFLVGEKDIIDTRKEKIKVRGWFDRTIEIKESTKGPVVSERELPDGSKEYVALTWMGHQNSNEIGAYLSVNRAKNFSEFRNSFKDFAVSGLNITYADAKGNISLLPVIRQPIIKDLSEQRNLVKSIDNQVVAVRRPTEMPYVYNPKSGFVASANNLAVVTTPSLALTTAENDRMRRWVELLGSKRQESVATLAQYQLDLFSGDAKQFRDLIVESLNLVDEKFVPEAESLRQWDARYNVESRGALVFEVLALNLAFKFYKRSEPNEKLRKKILQSDNWRKVLCEKLKSMSTENPRELQKLIADSFGAAERMLKRFANWGEIHTQTIQAPLGLVPVLGSRFRFGQYPAPGGATTLHKAAFAAGDDGYRVVFGAQSRHISDMGTLNDNYFVMLGGNDGWIKSPFLDDQVAVWREGGLINIPLELNTVKKTFTRHKQLLMPSTK